MNVQENIAPYRGLSLAVVEGRKLQLCCGGALVA